MLEVTEEESKEDTSVIASLLVPRYEHAAETNLILPTDSASPPARLFASSITP